MIDVHSHLLPSIDDGAESLDISVQMLDAAQAIGFRTIVATPHLVEPLSPDYAADIRSAFDAMEPHAVSRGITIECGFEIRLTADLPARLRAGEPITLAGTRAVLIDLPFTNWPSYVDDTLFAVQMSGFLPVLAHPERYLEIQQHPGLARELAERGVALQVTISSFSGLFGKRVKRVAEALIRLGAVHLVATDAHSASERMRTVPHGLRRLNELVGEENLQRLILETPRSLLNGDGPLEPITPLAPRGIRRIFAGSPWSSK